MPPKKIKPEVDKIEFMNVPLKKGFRYATEDEAIKANKILLWGKFVVSRKKLDENKQYIKMPTRVTRAKEFRRDQLLAGVKINHRKKADSDDEEEETPKPKTKGSKKAPHLKRFDPDHKYVKADIPTLEKFRDRVNEMMDEPNISDELNDELMNIEEQIYDIIEKLKKGEPEPESDEEPEPQNPNQGEIDRKNERISAIQKEVSALARNPNPNMRVQLTQLSKESNDLFDAVAKLSKWSPPKRKGKGVIRQHRATGGKFEKEHGLGNVEQPYFYWTFGKYKATARTKWRDATAEEAINNKMVSLYGVKKIPSTLEKTGQATGHSGNVKEMNKYQLQLLFTSLTAKKKVNIKAFEALGVKLDNADDPEEIENLKEQMEQLDDKDFELTKAKLRVVNAINKIDGKQLIKSYDRPKLTYVKSQREEYKPHKAYSRQGGLDLPSGRTTSLSETKTKMKTPNKAEEHENITIVDTPKKEKGVHLFSNFEHNLNIPHSYFDENMKLKTSKASKLRLLDIILHPHHYQEKDVSKFFYEKMGSSLVNSQRTLNGKGIAGGKIHPDKFFKKVGDTFSKVGHKIESGLTTAINTVDNGLLSAYNYAGKVINGVDDYLPPVRDIINKYANNTITGVTVGRAPVPTAITGALNVASGGTFQEGMNTQPYDKLFHLFLYLTLNDGNKILFEKNATINSAVNSALPPDTETKIISLPNNTTTLKTFLQKGQDKMGKDYFVYDPHYNNCQDYIMGLLTANGWGTQEDYQWIKQDTGQLFANNKYLGTIAKGVTNFGGIVDRAIKGVGIKTKMNKKKSHIQSILFKRPEWTQPNAEDWLMEHKFKDNVDVKPNHLRYRQMEPDENKYEYRTINAGNDIEFIIAYKK